MSFCPLPYPPPGGHRLNIISLWGFSFRIDSFQISCPFGSVPLSWTCRFPSNLCGCRQQSIRNSSRLNRSQYYPFRSTTEGKSPFPFGLFWMAGRVNYSPPPSVKLELIITLSAKQMLISNSTIYYGKRKYPGRLISAVSSNRK